jgi:hypothetical protein
MMTGLANIAMAFSSSAVLPTILTWQQSDIWSGIGRGGITYINSEVQRQGQEWAAAILAAPFTGRCFARTSFAAVIPRLFHVDERWSFAELVRITIVLELAIYTHAVGPPVTFLFYYPAAHLVAS